jgi:uncharacterized membrane protein YphA (DoxX/SURF4 family)
LFARPILWLWFAGLVVLAMGLISVRKEFAAAIGLDKIIVLGRVFAAASLALFGAEHLTGASSIAQGVPAWMPFHLFWAYFVGFALLAASLSLAWKIQVRLSATLFAIMMLLFVIMIHIPNVAANPHDRFAWTVVFRETSFAGGFLAFAGAAFAGTKTDTWRTRGSSVLVLIGRLCMAIPFLLFAVMHILHPQNAPGVPLAKLTPPWMPAPHTLAAFTGVLLFLAGAAILINKYARAAAAWLGLWMLLLTIGLYLPILFTLILAHTVQAGPLLEALNYIADTLLFSGVILLLASAMPADTLAKTAAPPSAQKL